MLEAYGWPADLGDEQILERLVALNKERAAQEKADDIKWLRPDYQVPRFGSDAERARLAEEKRQRRVELTVSALARLGHLVSTDEAQTFALRRTPGK